MGHFFSKDQGRAIFHGPQTTERLKGQTKYRLLVVEQKITLGGNKQALYDMLLAQLEAGGRAGSDTEDTTTTVPVTRTRMMNE